jgi:hypothetical protein
VKLFLAIALGLAFGVALIPYVARMLASIERVGPRVARRGLPFLVALGVAAVLVTGGIAGFNAVQRARATAAFTRDSTTSCVNVAAADTLVAAVERAIASHDTRYASPEAYDRWEDAKRVRARCAPYQH